MNHGSLFNGIGGFQLAARWMEWENIMSCEIDKFCNKVTKFHFPNCDQHEDIRTTDFSIYRGRIDILTGGFPCQPYSQAGKRLGKEDERHLWPQMLRAITEIQPGWVVGENVRGLTNWNGGLVFDEVQANLEAAGYEVLPFLLPACAVNAPHRRDRIWFIAHANNLRSDKQDKPTQQQRGTKIRTTSKKFSNNIVTDKSNTGLERTTRTGIQGESVRFTECSNGNVTNPGLQRQKIGKKQTARIKQCSGWESFPTQSPLCNGNDGLSSELDGITFSKWRQESIKAGGNAIVPQVALQIFKAIAQYEANAQECDATAAQ